MILSSFLFAALINKLSSVLQGEEVFWGIGIYNELIHLIESLANGESNIDYRAFHLLCEHKKAIYRRLLYIADEYRLCQEFNSIVQEYAKLVKGFNGIRLNVLKRCLDGCEIYAEMYKLPKDIGFIEKTVSSIRRNADIEKNLILKLQEVLKAVRIEGKPELFNDLP